MDTLTLQINGKPYPVKFCFRSNKILATWWNFKTVGEIGGKLAAAFQYKDGGEPTLDQLDTIGQLVLSGILADEIEKKKKGIYPPDHKAGELLDSDDVVQALIDDLEALPGIVENYMKCVPQKKNPVPEKNVKRGRKKQ